MEFRHCNGLHKSGLSRAITKREFCRAPVKIAERRRNCVVLSLPWESQWVKESKSLRVEGAREVTKRSEYWF